tara:strand:- start:821 stop:1990 length:1170 start_codon:yes stop_codon:yes gene_type:complete
MGNTPSAEEQQKDKYQQYIQQQQQQIQRQQQQINQLMMNNQRNTSQNRNQRNQTQYQTQKNQKQNKNIKSNQNTNINNRIPNNHPSVFTQKQVPQNNKTYMNPYKILNISKQYDKNILKKAYLRAAMKTHPDRGGDKDLFQQVTIAYTLLLKKLEKMGSDRQHFELKSGHDQYNEYNAQTRRVNVNFKDQDSFDSVLFNKIYDENRLKTEDDSGYGDWISKNPMDESCEDNPKLFNGKFNKSLFNNVFTEAKHNNHQRNKKSIIEYQEPQALNSGGHQLQVLGKGQQSDFSSQEVLESGIKYRDYKDAFTNPTLIDINSVNIGDRARDIKSYQTQRSNISHKMSPEEEAYYEKLQRLEKIKEQQRLSRLEKDDRQISNHYERVHKLLIR